MKVATTSARSREYDKVVIQRTVKSINDLHKTYTPSTMNKRVIHFNILFIGTPQRGTIPRPDSAKLQNCKKERKILYLRCMHRSIMLVVLNGIDNFCTLMRNNVYRTMQHMPSSENKIIACFNDDIVTREGNVWTCKQITGVGFVKQLAPDCPALSD